MKALRNFWKGLFRNEAHEHYCAVMQKFLDDTEELVNKPLPCEDPYPYLSETSRKARCP